MSELESMSELDSEAGDVDEASAADSVEELPLVRSLESKKRKGRPR